MLPALRQKAPLDARSCGCGRSDSQHPGGLKIPAFKRFAQKDLNVDHSKRLLCPQCPNDVVTMRRFPSVRRQTTADECPNCGGCWLDAGELAAVRAGSETEEARDRAAAQ